MQSLPEPARAGLRRPGSHLLVLQVTRAAGLQIGALAEAAGGPLPRFGIAADLDAALHRAPAGSGDRQPGPPPRALP